MIDTREPTSKHRIATPPTAQADGGSISRTVAAAAAVAWVVFVSMSFAVQPAPDPGTQPSATAELLSLLFTGALLAGIAGLGTLRRWGLVASMAGGLVMIAASIFCYVGGHTGAWIAIQLAAGVGLAVTSLGLLRAS